MRKDAKLVNQWVFKENVAKRVPAMSKRALNGEQGKISTIKNTSHTSYPHLALGKQNLW